MNKQIINLLLNNANSEFKVFLNDTKFISKQTRDYQ